MKKPISELLQRSDTRKIAQRTADVRLLGDPSPTARLLTMPLCSFRGRPQHAEAIGALMLIVHELGRASGVSRQPDANEVAEWAVRILGEPDWSSLPIAAVADFARQLVGGRWPLYDRLTYARFGECLREYAAEWRTRYKAEEDALYAEIRKAEAEQRAVQARAEYEAMMADPEQRAAYEQAKAELERFMGDHEQADRQRIRLDPKQRERIARDFANPTGE